MSHLTLPQFWRRHRALPAEIQTLANKNFQLLKADPFHPSLHLKKVGPKKERWSVRVGDHYRALGMDVPEGILWVWIGTHAEYDGLLK